MKKLIILFFIFIADSKLNAQSIQKSELENLIWFTDNSTKSFYKSDTISLIRITDTLTDILLWNKQYRELDYNKNNNITTIEFKKRNNLDILDHDVKSWTYTRIHGKWKWKFDFKTQVISFHFNKKHHSSFVIKEKLTDTSVWKYDFFDAPKEATFHFLLLTLVRVK